MRMPEPDSGHYENDLLNHGYVYTNLSDIEIHEDIAKNYITIYTSKRIKSYEPIQLSSVYRKRQREKTRLSPLFIQVFKDEADKYKLREKIKIKGQNIQLKLISDWEAENVDALRRAKIKAEAKISLENLGDMQRLFDYFVMKNLSPFYPDGRSIGRIKEAIYNYFSSELHLEYTDKFVEIINIILSEDNNGHFINVIDAAKERYIAETQKRQAEFEEIEAWQVPESLTFGGDYAELKTNKSVLQPFYYDHRWRTEKAFIDFLDGAKEVKWWFKNGDRDSTFFAVKYTEDGDDKPFYVDFIVATKDGRIGLLDTKSGRTIKDAKNKNDGLQKYIKERNKKGQSLFGGIVANTKRDFSGRWMVFTGKSENLKLDDFTNWELLEL